MATNNMKWSGQGVVITGNKHKGEGKFLIFLIKKKLKPNWEFKMKKNQTEGLYWSFNFMN